MKDLETRVLRVGADLGLNIRNKSRPVVMKLMRDLLGDGDSDLFDYSALAAALKGIAARHEQHFFAEPLAKVMSGFDKVDYANRLQSEREVSSPIPATMDLTDEEKAKVSKMTSAMKVDFFNLKAAEATKKN